MKSIQEIKRIIRFELLGKKVEVGMYISQQEMETQKLGEAFIEHKKKELAIKIAEEFIINNIITEKCEITQDIKMKCEVILINKGDFDLLLSNIAIKLI